MGRGRIHARPDPPRITARIATRQGAPTISELFSFFPTQDCDCRRPLLTTRVVHQAGRSVVFVSGEVDLSSAGLLESCGMRALRGAASCLVLDLSGVRFFDAAGLRALCQLRRRAGDGRLVLRDPSASVRRVLELAALTGSFTIVRRCAQLTPPTDERARRARARARTLVPPALRYCPPRHAVTGEAGADER